MALTSPSRLPPARAERALWPRLAGHTVAVAIALGAATLVLWQVDSCRVRWAADRAARVWGRPLHAWEARLDAPTARGRDSAIVALQELASRRALDARTRVRLARHLALRLADTAAETRALAVAAALDVVDPDVAATQALRSAAAALLAPGHAAVTRLAALEVLVRVGATGDDVPLIARTAATDPDAAVRALATAVHPHPTSP